MSKIQEVEDHIHRLRMDWCPDDLKEDRAQYIQELEDYLKKLKEK